MRSETAEAVTRSQRPSGGSRTPLLNTYGGPNQERSSPPLLTVLPLLTGEHLEEGDGEKNERTGSLGWVGTPVVFFCPLRWQYVFALLRFRVMDLLKACDEMKGFIETAQKLVNAWDADPDNYSQLEEGLSALKAELEKFKD